MKKLLVAAMAVLFAYPALADDIVGGPYSRMNGDEIESDTSTQITYSWGYWSNNVRLCLEDDSAQVYVRLGTVAATDSSTFIDGNANADTPVHGSAALLFPANDGTDVNCQVFPVRTQAMTFHQVTAGTATVHVQVFGGPVRE